MPAGHRATIKVSRDTHASIRVIAAALGVRHTDVVDRAVAHYRLRHTKAIARLMSRGGVDDLSELTYGERVDLLRDVIVDMVGGATVWVVQDQGAVLLAVEPAPVEEIDLVFDLEDLLGARVSVMAAEDARRRGYDLAAPPCRRL